MQKLAAWWSKHADQGETQPVESLNHLTTSRNHFFKGLQWSLPGTLTGNGICQSVALTWEEGRSQVYVILLTPQSQFCSLLVHVQVKAPCPSLLVDASHHHLVVWQHGHHLFPKECLALRRQYCSEPQFVDMVLDFDHRHAIQQSRRCAVQPCFKASVVRARWHYAGENNPLTLRFVGFDLHLNDALRATDKGNI